MSQNPPSQEAFRRIFRGFLVNLVQTRSTLLRGNTANGIDPPNRNLDQACGYPETPDIRTYSQLVRRNGIARRVVNVLPDESWAVYPDIYETDDLNSTTRFEAAWTDLLDQIPVLHYLHRADRATRLGRYGVLLCGFTGTGPLNTPVPGINPRTGERDAGAARTGVSLGYLRPFSEDLVTIKALETDTESPRFGQPISYEIAFGDPTSGSLEGKQLREVHWTRCQHLVDNPESSDTGAPPCLESVLNYVLDLRKIGGSSGEMFYLGGFPGYSVETLPDLVGESSMDLDEIAEQFQMYMQGLQRFVGLDGATAKSLSPQAVDPTAHAMLQLQLICATIGVPLRVFLGSETGHLASTQDKETWNRRLGERQTVYLNVRIIRPFIDRLIAVGVLPAPASKKYKIEWRDLNTTSDKDKALVSLQRAQALMAYVSGGCEAILPAKEFLTLVLGLTLAEAEAVMKAVEANTTKLTDPLDEEKDKRQVEGQIKVSAAKPKPAPVGGATRGNPPKAAPNRPAGGGPGS